MIAEGAAEGSGRHFISGTDAGDEGNLHEKARSEVALALITLPGNQQHGSVSVYVGEWEEKASVRPESIEPEGQRLGGSGIHIDRVALGDRRDRAGSRADGGLRQRSEVVSGALG